MNSPRLLILDDNPDFGGHQVMTAYIVEGLLRYGNWNILGLLNPGNERNIRRWSDISSIADDGRFLFASSSTSTKKFQALRSYFQTGSIKKLLDQIQQFQPTLILVIQGNIEQCSSVFSLKSNLSCPLLSYIPLPHTHVEMGAKLGWLRDLSCKHLYSVPDGYITISQTLAEMLADYGAKGKIQVVENGIPLDQYKEPISKKDARCLLGLPDKCFLWGHIGRIEFKQKGQDFSLSVFQKWSKKHPHDHLAFLGSGPDEDVLRRLVENMPNVHLLPWMNDPAPFYSAIDAMVIPSRYEGVPLVMLEALANCVPVISTDRDGMRDWLPRSWRFSYRDEAGMLKACDEAQSKGREAVVVLRDKVFRDHSITSLQKAFNSALEEWL